jgi:phage tail-like protein
MEVNMSDKKGKTGLKDYFNVQIDGVDVGNFSNCEGLEAETYIYEIEEGGDNTHTHKFLGRTRFPNIILEKGITDNNELFKWFNDTCRTDEKVERKSGTIILYTVGENEQKKEVKRWNFFDALPCRWVGPSLSSGTHGVAVERIEIACEYLEETKE